MKNQKVAEAVSNEDAMAAYINDLTTYISDYLPVAEEVVDGDGSVYSYTNLLALGKGLLREGGQQGRNALASMSAMPRELRDILLSDNNGALFEERKGNLYQVSTTGMLKFHLGAVEYHRTDKLESGGLHAMAQEKAQSMSLWHISVSEDGYLMFKNVKDNQVTDQVLRGVKSSTLTHAVVTSDAFDDSCKWEVCVSSKPPTNVGDVQSIFHLKLKTNDSRAFLSADPNRLRDGKLGHPNGSMYVSCASYEPCGPLQSWTIKRALTPQP